MLPSGDGSGEVGAEQPRGLVVQAGGRHQVGGDVLFRPCALHRGARGLGEPMIPQGGQLFRGDPPELHLCLGELQPALRRHLLLGRGLGLLVVR